ncbi:MAG: hypothetical protein ACE5LU_17990 [Anaerolineae bacterium]
MSEIKIIGVISKLCPRVKQGRVVELDDLADQIAGQSGFDRGDVRDFAYKFAQTLVNHLNHADYVKLGEIGGFRVGCDKDRQLKVRYHALKAIRDELANGFRGEFVNGQNAGLDEEGFAQRWLELHPEDTVIMRDGTMRVAGSE